MTEPNCPSESELNAYIGGKIIPPRADEIDAHLNDCEGCHETLDRIHSAERELTANLRQPMPTEFVNEAECEQAVARTLNHTELPSESDNERTIVTPPSVSTEATPARPSLGVLREYELLEKLGEGGMGAVYKARHTKLGKIVAIKVLPEDRMKDTAAVSRFEREMRAVGSLSHPNIVGASDAGEFEGQHYLVMEYVEGTDLAELVKARGPLSIADACELIRQAALGLQHAYENGLVHRDIKPSNLMLSNRGDVKILDLGLALLGEGQIEGTGELTSTGQIMGTVDYMAPEQGSDTHKVDIRADLYSLGATLYKLLTGRAPFQSARQQSILHRLTALATETPKPVTELRPDVPAELSTIVARLLAKKPAERLQTPVELTKALTPFCRQHTIGQPIGNSATLEVGHAEETSESWTPELATLPTVAAQRGGNQRKPPTRKSTTWLWGGFAAAMLAGIIVIATAKGRVTIDIPEGQADNVVVNVLSGGEVVEVLDKNNRWSVKLSSGEYTLKVKEGQDDVTLKDDRVTVSRFGTKVVDVEFKSHPVADHTPTKKVWSPTPEQQQFFDHVATLSLTDQYRAVTEKLADLNGIKISPPTGFFREEDRFVTAWIAEKGMNQIWPVCALETLEFLMFNGFGSEAVPPFEDLSPISRLRNLKRLKLVNTRVSSLAPLRGLQLGELDVSRTLVTDLTPLEGMPLTMLHCYGTAVSDLSPLKGMLLESIELGETKVEDISVLRGMPLKNLSVNLTRVQDWTPVRGMPLERLYVTSSSFSDTSLLKGMPLIDLTIAGTPTNDLEPLRGAPLKIVDLRKCKVTNLEPLTKSPLEKLNCDVAVALDHRQVLEAIPTLKTINGFPVAEFWKNPREVNATDESVTNPDSLQTDREIAEWYRQFDARVTVAVNGNPSGMYLVPDAPLPDEPFQIVGLKLARTSSLPPGILEPIARLPRLNNLVLIESNVTPEDLRQLEACPQLESLDLTSVAVDDETLTYVAKCPLLKTLALNRTKITAKGLALLKDLTLEHLQVHGIGLTQAGLDQIAQMASLTHLNLADNDLGPLDLSVLKELKNLTNIALHNSSFGDSDVAELLQIGQQLSVHVGKTGITATGLRELTQHPSLNDLVLSNHKLTGDDVTALTEFQKLKVLIVDGTGINQEQIQQLQQALPNCRIVWDGGIIQPEKNPAALEAERKLAEWVFAQGGTVTIRVFDGDQSSLLRNVSSSKQIPDKEFHVGDVFLRNLKTIDDEALAELCNLIHDDELYVLDLNGTSVTDDGIASLEGMTLRRLFLAQTSITDTGCASISRIRDLDTLDLSGTKITDEGVGLVATLPQLSFLALMENRQLGDDALWSLADHPTLKSLQVQASSVTDAGIHALIDTRLHTLELGGAPRLTRNSMKMFAQMKSLRKLDLSGSPALDDASLSELTPLRGLTSLVLNSSALTEQSLETIVLFRCLESLEFRHVKLSQSRLQSFRERMPQCRIIYDGGDLEPIGTEFDQRVARWAIDQGGQINVVSQGQILIITNRDRLPDSPFMVNELRLPETAKVTVENVDTLCELRSLRHLNLANVQLPEGMLQKLEKIGSLQHLNLSGTQATDEDLAALGRLPLLGTLAIGNTKVTAGGLRHFANHPSLVSLSLTPGQLTPESISHLNAIPGFQDLHLGEARDEDLKLIPQLKQLKDLNLAYHSDKLTRGAIENLHRQIPHCRIRGFGETIEPTNP